MVKFLSDLAPPENERTITVPELV